ncbi:MAG: PilZ domain-containing protein [Desulfopila sp.]|jgi:hypothetical protein|nr:PilZ domain-containing protein [Desulfopila sp.]
MKTSKVVINKYENTLIVAFHGIINPKEMKRIYTDVRFHIADLQPGFNVIADFSECRFMYLGSLATFKSLFQYILKSESGEIIRVIQKKRIISKQILNYTFNKPGYKPTYLATREEAERIIKKSSKRDGLRFKLHKKPCLFTFKNKSEEGYILNISTSGCAISSNGTNPVVGDVIDLKLSLKSPTSTRDFTLKAKVVWIESYTFAVQFTDITDIDKTGLKACLITETENEPI